MIEPTYFIFSDSICRTFDILLYKPTNMAKNLGVIRDDGETYWECPFESSHLIRSSRLQIHLARCQKSFPNIKLARCHFNSVHRVVDHKLAEHLIHCPDRHLADSEIGCFLVAIRDNGIGWGM